MKIAVKNLKGEVTNIQIDAEATILDLKQKMKQEKGLEVDTQKIVFKGKATNNPDMLSAIGVKENDFMVVMNLPKKVEKKVEEPKEKNVEAGKQESVSQEKKEEKVPEKQEKSKNETQNAQFDTKVTQLMNMGFDREKCTAALRAAFGDADRAVQYLLNGIPAQLPEPGQQQQGGEERVENVFRMLMNNPAFAQIKQLIRSDPSSLQPILQQISQSSPELYAKIQIISQHPETFQRVILEDNSQEGGVSMPPSNSNVIQITQEQASAIERLMSFGFTKRDSAQAYFACDKNQELAANLLFDRQANGDLQPLGEAQQPGGGQNNQGGNNNDDDDDDNLFN